METQEAFIEVTPKAKEQIKKIISESNYDDSYFLRVAVESGGCSGLSYKLSFANTLEEKDQLSEQGGVKIAMDMKSFLYLAGTTLDYSDGLNGKGFNFINPNASRTCACGESFSV